MISVLIPYRAGDRHHDANWAWTHERWRKLLPHVELIVQTDDGGNSTAEFNHPLALNRAAAKATHDLLLVADIDIVPDPDWIDRAVEAVKNGAPWVATERYLKLSKHATRRLLLRPPAANIAFGPSLEEPPIVGSCAPPVLITREGFEASGGYDERIGWWGPDDGIFRICVDTFWGPLERVKGDALHLWHPRPDPIHRHQDAQHTLVFAYQDAAGDKEAVQAVRYG
jgi:hypothetical protein